MISRPISFNNPPNLTKARWLAPFLKRYACIASLQSLPSDVALIVGNCVTINEGSVVLNDTTVAEFPVNGEAWEEMVSNSKFADWENFGKFKTGKIALQHHGEPIVIGYRNIKIKEL